MNTEQPSMNIFKLRRWIGVALFLAVFSLPFHFHAASAVTSKITNECSCLHGTRTHMALAAVAPQCAPALLVNLQESLQPELIPQTVSCFQAIRAPPAL